MKYFGRNPIAAASLAAALALAGCSGEPPAANSHNQNAAGQAAQGNAANSATANTEAGRKIVVTLVADGRDEPKEATPTAGEQAFADNAFADKEADILSNSKLECDDAPARGVQILGMVDGAFTKKGAAQRAYLYERCRAGRSFGIGGIIIAEGQGVAAHYQFGDGGLFSEIRKTTDINQDGVDEIVLIGGGTGQGYTQSGLVLLQFPDGGYKFLGRTELFEDNSGAVEDDTKIATTAYRVFAMPNRSPEFLRDTFEKKGDAKDWSPARTDESITLKTDEPLKVIRVV